MAVESQKSQSDAATSSTSQPASNAAVTSPRQRAVDEVGKYKFIRTIGKGNFAKVKSAKHLETGVEVAIKIIDKSALNQSTLQKVSELEPE